MASQKVTALIDGVFIEHPVCLVTAAAAARTLLSATIACKSLLTTAGAARLRLPAALCTLCQQQRRVIVLAAPAVVNSGTQQHSAHHLGHGELDKLLATQTSHTARCLHPNEG